MTDVFIGEVRDLSVIHFGLHLIDAEDAYDIIKYGRNNLYKFSGMVVCCPSDQIPVITKIITD